LGDLLGEIMSANPWYSRINISALDDEVRRTILLRVKSKLGFNRILEVLDVAKSSLHNYLHGFRRVPDEVVEEALRYLDEGEFYEIVRGVDRLRAVGIIRRDGSVDYSLILQAVALASRDEYLKQAILRFTVENFREDLRKMLGVNLAHVTFKWEPGFEEFLKTRKKRRKVLDPGTVSYYRSLFKKHLEGKTLSEELVEYVINYENKWLRNVFRHYVQYLYYLRKIPPETYGWLMEVVPSRSYKLDVRPYPINLEDVEETMRYLRENHELYYLIYRLMLESGLRLSHTLLVVEEFNPRELVEILGVGLETERLVCFESKGFCRYYVGIRGSQKPCEWAYFSVETLRLLEKHAGRTVNRNSIRKYAKRNKLVLPKYMRKIAWRLMIRVMPREVARFVQSRLGELRISEARYEDLLGEADQYYPKYLAVLGEKIYKKPAISEAETPQTLRKHTPH